MARDWDLSQVLSAKEETTSMAQGSSHSLPQDLAYRRIFQGKPVIILYYFNLNIVHAASSHTI